MERERELDKRQNYSFIVWKLAKENLYYEACPPLLRTGARGEALIIIIQITQIGFDADKNKWDLFGRIFSLFNSIGNTYFNF